MSSEFEDVTKKVVALKYEAQIQLLAVADGITMEMD